MVTKELRAAWRFHVEHGGYSVPPGRAMSALRAARAELLLREGERLGVASLEWVDDAERWDEGTEISAEEAAEKFASGEWTGPYGCVVWVGAELELERDDAGRDPAGWTDNASLWGIVVGPAGTQDPYCRVVAADLALELEDDLRQAIGDARDMRARCSRVAFRLAGGIGV